MVSHIVLYGDIARTVDLDDEAQRSGDVALAVAVSLTMGITCYAADTGVTVSDDTSFTITKEIVVTNTDSSVSAV